jgi:hypothetical protein
MLASILGARLSWHVGGWVFEPAVVGPDTIDFVLKVGPRAGRYLESQTVHRYAALPAWLAKDMTVYRGDNQDPAFLAKIRKLSTERPDWPRHLINDDGLFRVM